MRAGRWEAVRYRELRDPVAMIPECGVTDDEETSGALFANCLEGPVHIVTSRSFDPYRENRCAQCWSCGLGNLQLWRVVDINALSALAPLPRAPVPRPSRPQPHTPPPAQAQRTLASGRADRARPAVTEMLSVRTAAVKRT